MILVDIQFFLLNAIFPDFSAQKLKVHIIQKKPVINFFLMDASLYLGWDAQKKVIPIVQTCFITL